MNVFRTTTSKTLDLTIENFEDATNKMPPYYQTDKKGTKKYYAICPVCKNPVIVVNLYKPDYIDDLKNRVSLHARHCGKSIAGIANYNAINYHNCPLHNEKSFGQSVLRNNNNYNQHLENIIQNNIKTIKKYIRDILGINFSNNYLNQIINNYISNRNYQYEHTNEFNIPYSIIYTSQAFSLFGRYVQKNNRGIQIANAINNESNYFKVNNDRIEKTANNTTYSEINIQLCHHRKRNTRWYLTLKLTETVNNNTNILFKEEFEMKNIIL